MDEQYDKRTWMSRRRPKAEIHKRTLKNIKLENARPWGIHGFWFKKFASSHNRLALEMNNCLQIAHVPKWINKRRTRLTQKDPSKGTGPNIYRPITCPPMMLKILTAQIKEEIYYSLTSRGLFPKEQKCCCKGFRGTADLLYIDRLILNVSKVRRKYLSMTWVDYKSTWYYPQSWIINCLKMFKISHKVITIIEKIMKTWREELTA